MVIIPSLYLLYTFCDIYAIYFICWILCASAHSFCLFIMPDFIRSPYTLHLTPASCRLPAVLYLRVHLSSSPFRGRSGGGFPPYRALPVLYTFGVRSPGIRSLLFLRSLKTLESLEPFRTLSPSSILILTRTASVSDSPS